MAGSVFPHPVEPCRRKRSHMMAFGRLSAEKSVSFVSTVSNDTATLRFSVGAGLGVPGAE